MGSFEDELAQAKIDVEREQEQSRAWLEAQERGRINADILFRSTVREHLPQLMQEVKPYAVVDAFGNYPLTSGRHQEVWVVEKLFCVRKDGSPLAIRYLQHDDLDLHDLGFQGSATVLPWGPIADHFSHEYDGWVFFDDEIWYGTQTKKTKLVTYIARAIVRG